MMNLTHPLSQPQPENQFYLDHVNCLTNSLKSLAPHVRLAQDHQEGVAFARSIYEAPFILVSHNMEPDPVFNYANQAALDLFEMNWESFIEMPSRQSAERDHQQERSDVMGQVDRHGIVYDYSGIRVSKTGKRFVLEDGMIWNVVDVLGDFYGQAALFYQWRYL